MEHSQGSQPARHEYTLFDGGQLIARLEWRSASRSTVGWYLAHEGRAAVRLAVDPAIDDLARDARSAEAEWQRTAELAAILSTALALDAAERLLHRRPQRPTGRFRRLTSRQRFEIYVTDIAPNVLLHAIPELPLSSVSDVTVLAGELLPEAFEAIARRIALLGGRVVATFHQDADAPGE
jgi:hypothetical protein